MRILIILLFLLCGGNLIGQSYFLQDGELAFDSLSTNLIRIGAERIDESNALSREMLSKFLFGGHISDSEKTQVRNRLEGQNYYGGKTTPDLTYTNFQPNKDFGVSVSYRYRNLSSFQFTDDLYTMIFYGNNEFRESPAVLGKSSLKVFNYQSLSIGLVNKKSGSNISLGLYDNRVYSEIGISETTLNTVFNSSQPYPFAEEISLQAGSYSSRQSTGQSLFSSGIGIGLSGEYSFELDGSQFILEVQDLGAMYIKNLQISDTSGVFEYGGFDWDIGEESPLNNVFSTLEDSLSPSIREADEWIMLPALFSLSYISPMFGNFYLRADGNYRVEMGFNPELGVAINYRVNNDNTFWVRPVVGGFSDFSVGVGAQLNVFEKTLMQFGSNHLFGIVSGGGRSTSLFIQLIQRI